MTPPELPTDIAALTVGAAWQAEPIGMSGASVWRATLPGGVVVYLKRAAGPLCAELRRETEVLRWLRGRLPVPEVLAATTAPEQCDVLLAAVPGIMACDPRALADPPRLVRALATTLQAIHGVPVAACPFPRRLDATLAVAAERVAAGLVAGDDFDADHSGVTPADILARLQRERPATEDLVFTHGDYCLPNVLLDPATLALNGVIDLGRAGIADRYQDLAIACRSLDHNLGPGWAPLLLQTYGMPDADPAKLEYYRLLDELF